MTLLRQRIGPWLARPTPAHLPDLEQPREEETPDRSSDETLPVAPDVTSWSNEDWISAEAKAQELFNPSSPIDRERFFSGRLSQVSDLLDAIHEKGAHAILYGERGVGKSSLANIIAAKIAPAATRIRFLRENCRPEDTFFTLWSKILFEHRFNGVSIPELLKNEAREFVVIKVLEELPKNLHYVFAFDEFDRISSPETKVAIADTIKHFSDYPKNVTIVIVGVGQSVEQLFGAHPSIQRCCRQILLPRMPKPELRGILTDRYARIGLRCSDEMTERVVDLSCGFPGYLHLAGREAALSALRARRAEITEEDYLQALGESVRRTQESIVAAYNKATYSAYDNIYKQVLLACAMASSDERGMFSAADIRDALTEILGRRIEIANFTRHLAAFCDAERGPVLRKDGKEKPIKYQFVDAALQRYVFLLARKGRSDCCPPRDTAPETRGS